MDLAIERRTEGTWTIIAVEGEIDLLTAPTLRDRVMKPLEDGVFELVLDMSKVTFLDSSGLGVLVALHKRLRERDGRLVIVATARPVLSVLNLTGLDKVFDVYSRLDEALTTAKP
jgi:anti-sigma B factor antagonist